MGLTVNGTAAGRDLGWPLATSFSKFFGRIMHHDFINDIMLRPGPFDFRTRGKKSYGRSRSSRRSRRDFDACAPTDSRALRSHEKAEENRSHRVQLTTCKRNLSLVLELTRTVVGRPRAATHRCHQWLTFRCSFSPRLASSFPPSPLRRTRSLAQSRAPRAKTRRAPSGAGRRKRPSRSSTRQTKGRHGTLCGTNSRTRTLPRTLKH